jgi:trimeric autotransporter adhesin
MNQTMKIKILISTLALLALASISGRAATIGTEFTYQGRLTDVTGPPSGSYDFTFTLHLAASGGVPVVTVTNLNTAVSNGLFTTAVDFGGGSYNGNAYWISLGVRSNGVAGSFTPLTPRQPLSPTPNASYAALAGTVPGGSITSTKLAVDSVTVFALQSNSVTTAKVAAGQLVKSLNGLRDDVVLSAGPNVTITPSGNTLTIDSSGWKLGGNAGTTPGVDFLGTPDNQALELHVNGLRALRLEPNGTAAASITGGYFQNVNSPGGVVAGGGTSGSIQKVTGLYGAILGGHGNEAGIFGFIGGGAYNSATGSFSVVSCGEANIASGDGAAISGGTNNTASGLLSTVSGGAKNSIQTFSSYAMIGGGFNNLIGANAEAATISGGEFNTDGAFDGTLGGGRYNFIGGVSAATIGGGDSNTNKGDGSVIGGGFANSSSGSYSTTPGGAVNVANGMFSFAAGWQAQALHDGAFVWADSTGAPFGSTAPNQFLVRAAGGVGIGTGNPQGSLHVYSGNNPTTVRIQSTGTPGFGRVEFVSNPQGDANEWRPGFIQSTDNGGFTGGLGFYVNGTGSGNKFATNEVMRIVNGSVGIGTNTPQQKLHVIGNILASGTVTGSSDRNAKEHFAGVNPRDVLERVATLPISRWNYKTETEVTHLGPMAQDFYAAFNIGMDDKHISMVDADGVALAAIQGLNQKMDSENAALRAENAELQQRLEKLEQLIHHQNGGEK